MRVRPAATSARSTVEERIACPASIRASGSRQRRGRGRCCPPGVPEAPSVAEPRKQRSRQEAAEEDPLRAADESGDARSGQVGLLERAERHQAVADQRRKRAAEPEQRGALRLPLRTAREERQNEPRRREQAYVGHPGVHREAAEVLISGTESCREKECEGDEHASRVPQGWTSFPAAFAGTPSRSR